MVSWKVAGLGIYAVALLVAAVYGYVAITPSQTQTASLTCFTGASSGTLPRCLPSETISETGSALMYPLMNLWVRNFSQLYPNVPINTANTGSGVGQSYAIGGNVNIGASSAYLSDAQLKQNPKILNIGLAVSAIIVNYNLPGFPLNVHLNFSGPVLAQIYNGTISNWNDPIIRKMNPGAARMNLLPDHAILPIHRSDGSGDTLHFTEYLSRSDYTWYANVGKGISVKWPSFDNAQSIIGNPGIVIECHALQFSISYVAVEALDLATSYNLGSAYLQNLDGNFVEYSPQNIEAGLNAAFTNTPNDERISLVLSPGENAYPILTYAYALVSSAQKDPNIAGVIRTFLTFSVLPQYGNSPSLLNQFYFLPLPASVRQLSLAQINQIQAS